jgi:hypothetical protein
MSARLCPVPACDRALGTTRQGDPFVFCPQHYHSLSRIQQVRLWQHYRAWKRLEKQRLRIYGRGPAAPSMRSAITEAIKEYLLVRDDCIQALTERHGAQLEMAQ